MDTEFVGPVSRYDTLARFSLYAVFFLLPIFAIPSAVVPLGFSKTAFFIVVVCVALLLWAVARLRDGEVTLPRGALMPLLGLIVLVSVVATLASGAVPLSWSGTWFEAGTLAFVVALAAFLFLIVALIRSAEQIFYAYLLVLSSASLLVLFHLFFQAFDNAFHA